MSVTMHPDGRGDGRIAFRPPVPLSSLRWVDPRKWHILDAAGLCTVCRLPAPWGDCPGAPK